MKRLVTFLAIILGLALGFGISARAVSDRENMSQEEYRLAQKAFEEEVRDILLEKGCKNAGVTVTYISDGEGHREYFVTVHHRKLTQMNNTEWSLLQARVQEAGKSFLSGNEEFMVKILSDI